MILRRPLTHFILLGGLLFAGQRFLPDDFWSVDASIHIATSDVQQLRANWLRETARTPSEGEFSATLDKHVDEEVLLHEALRLGLDEIDPVARERLLMNMRFAFPDARNDETALLREARRLGMNTRDVVVRRRLIQVMEARIAEDASIAETDLRQFLERHPDRFSSPPRVGFRHVFLSSDLRGGDVSRDAQVLLEQLRAQRQPAAPMGDSFLLGERFAPQTAEEIARTFGPDFAQAVVQMPEQQWLGPVRSAYGLHLVRVEQKEAGAPADFAAVRAQLAYALMPELEAVAVRKELTRQRRRYRVKFESTAVAGELTP